jgi:hypothetical protein
LPPDTLINNRSFGSVSDYTFTNTDIDIYCYILQERFVYKCGF